MLHLRQRVDAGRQRLLLLAPLPLGRRKHLFVVHAQLAPAAGGGGVGECNAAASAGGGGRTRVAGRRSCYRQPAQCCAGLHTAESRSPLTCPSSRRDTS